MTGFQELRWWRLTTPLAAAALFGIARLVPESGFGLWLRLAAATLVLLLPGRFVSRALGRRSLAATLVWSVVLVGFGLALTFALGTSILVTLAFALGAGAVALVLLVVGREREGEPLPARGRIIRGVLVLGGLIFGAAIWSLHGVLAGDGFFHLGRIRKLDSLNSLSLHDVGEFRNGGLHPGYAFPLWHGWEALVARLAGVDPTSVALHESSLLVPLVLVLFFEMGWAVFRSTGLALAVVLAQFALKALAPAHGGVYPTLWQPGTAATQLLAPAAVSLFFVFLREPDWTVALTLAGAAATLALVHPTYALFLAIPLCGFLVARLLLSRGTDWKRALGALVAFGVPMGLAFLWLLPIVRETNAVSPGPAQLAKSLQHYIIDLNYHSLTSYSLSPQRVDRSGSVAIAALILTPLALLARKRRWAAFVLGGTVCVLAIELLPFVFPHFADVVSLSQARRAAIFIPFAVAFAGGFAVIAGFSRLATFAIALGAGIWLQITYGGDFGLRAPTTEPALAAWVAFYGGAAALLLGVLLVWFRRDDWLPDVRRRDATVAFAALLFVLPVMVHGFSHLTPKPGATGRGELTSGLIRFLQHDVPPRSVVFGDLGTSYAAVGYAPVYTVAVPPTHAANTKQNQIFKRKRAWFLFISKPSLYEPRRWYAQWLILKRGDQYRLAAEPAWKTIEAKGLKPAYKDHHFVVFAIPPGPVPLKR